jgi:hypothetical protein
MFVRDRIRTTTRVPRDGCMRDWSGLTAADLTTGGSSPEPGPRRRGLEQHRRRFVQDRDTTVSRCSASPELRERRSARARIRPGSGPWVTTPPRRRRGHCRGWHSRRTTSEHDGRRAAASLSVVATRCPRGAACAQDSWPPGAEAALHEDGGRHRWHRPAAETSSPLRGQGRRDRRRRAAGIRLLPRSDRPRRLRVVSAFNATPRQRPAPE